MDEELEKRLAEAVEEAEFAFWAVIADKFPEAEWGDLDPLGSMIFSIACKDVAREWVATNTELIPEKE